MEQGVCGAGPGETPLPGQSGAEGAKLEPQASPLGGDGSPAASGLSQCPHWSRLGWGALTFSRKGTGGLGGPRGRGAEPGTHLELPGSRRARTWPRRWAGSCPSA